jgi:hypothetical protein
MDLGTPGLAWRAALVGASAALTAVAAAGAAPLDFGRIAAPSPSTAVALRIGDQLHGPGALTVGHFGARKQLVLPAGDWVLLSAVDHQSTHKVPLAISTLVWGRFEGDRLRTTLQALFVSRPGAVGNSWREMTQCEALRSEPRVRQQARGQTSNVNHCLVASAGRALPLASWGGAWVPVREHLQRLGAQRDDGRLLRTEMVLQDNRGGFMWLLRFDFGALEGQAPAAVERLIEQRADWAAAYIDLAAEGLGGHLTVQDLQPGQRDAQRQLRLSE